MVSNLTMFPKYELRYIYNIYKTNYVINIVYK